jgi:putative transposase
VRPGPDAPAVWDDVGQLELEPLAWVHWFNERRLHGHCHDVPPAEFYAGHQTTPTGVGDQLPESLPIPGGSVRP